MRADQLLKLETLRDRLLDVAMRDADPENWTAGGKAPKDMTREERGDAKWCRALAISTVALTMQVTRLMLNPATGGASVPDEPGQPEQDEAETVDAEIARYEAAATEVLQRAARGGSSRGKR